MSHGTDCYQVSWCIYLGPAQRRRGTFSFIAPDAEIAEIQARIAVKRNFPDVVDERIAIGDVVPVGAAA